MSLISVKLAWKVNSSIAATKTLRYWYS